VGLRASGGPATIVAVYRRQSADGVIGPMLQGISASYPGTENAIRDVLTPRGLHMYDWSGYICATQLVADFAFRHIQFWFNSDPYELARTEPFIGHHRRPTAGNVETRSAGVHLRQPLRPVQSMVGIASAGNRRVRQRR
jgi:hypothetical protein